ncbi:MAG: ribosome biogenesis GTPase Der [Gammaproteobacteria bacterium]|nr:ribosome biogenesis GTPase Der [Gammaproteobacteria bacterium]
MLPVVAIVGRPNVGKSTLFNHITGTRAALVADMPGLTRDRQYGTVRAFDSPFVVIDTGGVGESRDEMALLVDSQAAAAIEEADHILFLVDGRSGALPADRELAARLRRFGKPITLAVNKTDGVDIQTAQSDFFELSLGEPFPIAASHGRGVRQLLQDIYESLPQPASDGEVEAHQGVRIAFVGKPNAGKSTLVNQLLGEERVLTHSVPGTTRDSVFIPFQRRGRDYVLIDTAGVRRRARVTETIEKFSVVKTLQAIESANVVVYMLDAMEGFTDHDAHLLGHCLDAGRGLVIALNKWDLTDSESRRPIISELERRLRFFDYARTHHISAQAGTGIAKLLVSVDKAWAAASRDLPTPVLTRVLNEAVERHAPPLVKGRRVKLRYAHQGGTNPPRIVIHGNQTEYVPDSYTRYLSKVFVEAFRLEGTPVRVEYKRGDNPFKDKRNPLTERQVKKRRRLMRHVKRRR